MTSSARRKLLEAFRKLVKGGEKVLDVGCGIGRLSSILKELGCIVYGVDISREMIEIAKRRVDGIFKVASAYNLPFPDCWFDAVVLYYLIDGIADPVKALMEAKRVTKIDGRVIISVLPLLSSVREKLTYKRFLKTSPFNGMVPAEVPPLLREVGLTLKEVHYVDDPLGTELPPSALKKKLDEAKLTHLYHTPIYVASKQTSSSS